MFNIFVNEIKLGHKILQSCTLQTFKTKPNDDQVGL